ncbi:MAG: hypothetical protein CVV64_04960 [Candidatus Wallbacteria bacterium HGW-Wallbacteria-1]|uniref:FHA domain-containing protein n=1 Tax=Candidatus Wallbacteria bacterium HGW-Wallbacteria-1 TaxID=2013854 RepID=A0A2N1PS13_9BACT|nr:MAG: hypothetical protein CVV64_04960 [Candidatus Wallbacteria bacterium HGW-Wallbacteria-1]
MGWFGLKGGQAETRTSTILVGSDPELTDLVLEDSQVLSIHAEIYGNLEDVAGGQMVRMYISSKNGGMIKILPPDADVRDEYYRWEVLQDVELRSGDRLIIGPFEIRVREVEDPDLSDEESPYEFELINLREEGLL